MGLWFLFNNAQAIKPKTNLRQGELAQQFGNEPLIVYWAEPGD